VDVADDQDRQIGGSHFPMLMAPRSEALGVR
jgi:hypothetical protein